MDKIKVEVELDQDVYEQAKLLCEDLGLDIDTAINMSLVQMLYHDGLPFPVHLPPFDLPHFDEPPHRGCGHHHGPHHCCHDFEDDDYDDEEEIEVE